MTDKKPLNTSEFNREMIMHLTQMVDNLQKKTWWLEKQLREVKEYLIFDKKEMPERTMTTDQIKRYMARQNPNKYRGDDDG